MYQVGDGSMDDDDNLPQHSVEVNVDKRRKSLPGTVATPAPIGGQNTKGDKSNVFSALLLATHLFFTSLLNLLHLFSVVSYALPSLPSSLFSSPQLVFSIRFVSFDFNSSLLFFPHSDKQSADLVAQLVQKMLP